MEKINWTPNQQQAIDSRGNTLVSAAAGSGKTATLTAKIISLLAGDENVSIRDFLIVTYTKAAASEMKAKISKELAVAAKTNPALSHNMRDIASSDICTIHSFCAKVLREKFTAAGLSPDFAVADDSIAALLKTRSAMETIDDFFRGDKRIHTENAVSIHALADAVGRTKDSTGFDAAIIKLTEKLISIGKDEGFLYENAELLEKYSEGDFLDSPWGRELICETLAAAEHNLRFFSTLRDEMAEDEKVAAKYGPAADALCEYFERICAAKNYGYQSFCETLASYSPVNLGKLSSADKTYAAVLFQKERKEIMTQFSKFTDRYFGVSEDSIKSCMVYTASMLKALGDVVSAYLKRYSELKRERGVLDFSDLELFALKLLEKEDGSPSDVALEIGKRYKFVFIDEYQDTNSVQDRIFRCVSTESEKFFVGDIKQSIYRFRGAEPKVFSGYRNAWPSDRSDSLAEGYPAGRSIFMSENFRCAKPIIEFANGVSRYVFPHGGIPFTEDDCLVYGGKVEGDVPVELCLIDGGRGIPEEDAVSESEYVAHRVLSLLNEGKYCPRDIAILLRSANTSGGKYEKALKKLGIPVNRNGGSPFAEEPEVVLVLDILRAVDNPTRDIPLAGAMLSSVFGFTMEDLVKIRHGNTACPLYSSVLAYCENGDELGTRCLAFTNTLEKLRNIQRGMSADRFIEYLYSELNLYDCPEITSKYSGVDNLLRIFDLAKSYESGVFGGLYGFISYIDEKLSYGELNVEDSESTDGVTIISIHKSKGLEYPVCIIAECGKKRNTLDERNQLLFDTDLGVAMRLPDEGGLVLCSNPLRDSLTLKSAREGSMEELRILYVAMTRARERLILTGKCLTNAEDELAKLTARAPFADGFTVISDDRILDHVINANIKYGGICKVTFVKPDFTEEREALEEKDETDTESFELFDAERVSTQMAFSYPYGFLENIPAKLSVSKLYPTILDYDESLESVELFPEIPDKDEESTDEEEMPYPKFMTGSIDTTPAEKGISNHMFLQFADFSALRTDASAELCRLVEQGFITEKMASQVDISKAEVFARDGLVSRFLEAKRTLREFRFNILMDAADFTENGELAEKLRRENVKLTVQGVFDCVFEDATGKLVLLDYKTDSMSSYELKHPEAGRKKLMERHKKQLTYYAKAVGEIFGSAPDEVYIYSLTLGEAIPVEI